MTASEGFRFIQSMSDSPRLTPGKREERAERDKRLARALRENLRRRKQQVRIKQSRGASPATDLARDDPPA